MDRRAPRSYSENEVNTHQNNCLCHVFLMATHLMMGSDSCRPSRLRFCNLEHWDRMPWRVDTSITELDRSMCCTRKGLGTEEGKERLC